MNETQIAIALIGGLSALAVAVVGLVGVLASRNEPRAIKELVALNTILEELPAGQARAALEERRTRVAITYGARREPLGVFAVAYLFFFGGYLLSLISVLMVGGDAGAWQSLVTSLLLGLIVGGLVFVLIGVLLFTVGIVFRVRDWKRGRNLQSSTHRESATTAEHSPGEPQIAPVNGAAVSPAGVPPTH